MLVTNCLKGPPTYVDFLDNNCRIKKMDMLGSWTVGRMYRVALLMEVDKELLKCTVH
jgi:hypothetical protein